MTNELKDSDINDMLLYDRDDNMMIKVKWSAETSDIDNRFLREYNNMCKLMKNRQITDYYEAQRHIQSTMMGDTPVKTVQNRQYIDNVSNYDNEHYRISKSKCHKLDLGQLVSWEHNSTPAEAAAAIKIQDKIEGNLKHICKVTMGNIEMKYTKGQQA